MIAEELEDFSKQAAAFFILLDTNNDGKLTQSERASAVILTPETLPNELDEGVTEFLSYYDAESDDIFTLEEW